MTTHMNKQLGGGISIGIPPLVISPKARRRSLISPTVKAFTPAVRSVLNRHVGGNQTDGSDVEIIPNPTVLSCLDVNAFTDTRYVLKTSSGLKPFGE